MEYSSTHRTARQGNHVARRRHDIKVKPLSVLTAESLWMLPNPPLTRHHLSDDDAVERRVQVGGVPQLLQVSQSGNKLISDTRTDGSTSGSGSSTFP